MSLLSRSGGNFAVNGYRNGLNRISSEINRNMRDMRLEHNNRRDEVNDLIDDINRELGLIQSSLDNLSFE